jgi:hypothetical protein
VWCTFKNAFVRKLGYILAALLIGLLLGHKSHAAGFAWSSALCGGSSVVGTEPPFTTFSPISNACAAQISNSVVNAIVSGAGVKTTCVTTGGTSQPDPPTAAGQTGCVEIQACSPKPCSSGFTHDGYAQATSIAVGTGTCATAAGTYDMQTPSGHVETPGTAVCGNDACNYTMGPTTSFRSWTVAVSGKVMTTQSATTTGAAGGSCGYSLSTPAVAQSTIDTGTPVQDCQSFGSTISCTTQSATGVYCGTYNGDQVCLGAVPAGKCVAFASGGAACTVAAGSSAQSPPAPDTGSAGTAATPTASLTQTVSGTTTTTNYYNSTVVAASHNAVSAPGSTGTSTGTTTGTTSTGTTVNGSVSVVPNAANGDCGASSVGCTADGTVPTLSTQPTAGSSLNTYFAALSSVPIVAAFSGIGSAWSGISASCPTWSLSMFSHTYTIDAHCSMIEGMGSALAAIMLAIYTLIGFRIVMSA